VGHIFHIYIFLQLLKKQEYIIDYTVLSSMTTMITVSRMWHYVAKKVSTRIVQEPAASTFKVQVLKMMLFINQISWCHIPEYSNLINTKVC